MSLKHNLSGYSSKMFLFLGMLLGVLASLKLPGIVVTWNMLQITSLDFDFCMSMDWITLVFSSVLCMIVSSVLKFSVVYMESDMFQTRFTWLVLTFVLSMFCLIFMPHFFFMLIGWDGLGMTSFLLVIYYLSDSSWAAGMKTYLMNRVGDSFFIMGLVLFLSNGYWDINTCSNKEMLCLVVMLGCFTKSAQFPFSSWLPAAMAAPTPVSSLVHSSTLVTAGMYVMMRLCHMFPSWLFGFMGVSGMWTLYSASLAACCEFDAKKVVAYSTLSQLGLMTVSISLNLPMVAFFHLMTHAMFKALMFMCVGYLIKNSGHFQDLRSLKGLWNMNPLLANTMVVSSLSLMGFPFLSGFFSKELILEKNLLMMKTIFHFFLLFSLPLTSYYSCRLCFQVLKGVTYSAMTCRDDGNVKIMSMAPLYMGSVCGGSLMSSHIYSLSSMYPCHAMKFFVVLFMLLGVGLSWMDVKMKKNTLLMFFGTLCYLSPFKGSFWTKNFINVGSDAYCLLDQGILSNGMDVLDERMMNVGEKLHASFSYFLVPRASFYMAGMGGMSVLAVAVC